MTDTVTATLPGNVKQLEMLAAVSHESSSTSTVIVRQGLLEEQRLSAILQKQLEVYCRDTNFGVARLVADNPFLNEVDCSH
ncbi:MAG: hypothetical protein AAF497_09480, partial [Planctomycetota bacterium]